MGATVSCYSEPMEDVPHPRLHKRKNTYCLRASYPADLLHLFKGKERWKSLGTSDYREAVRRSAPRVRLSMPRWTGSGQPTWVHQRTYLSKRSSGYVARLTSSPFGNGEPARWSRHL
ncbi:DUF6538 domain-containing protein [Bradyrhizobium liaoningense]|uniref:DUF6538 domain-containing protein n=1 Tax=Bradyrhizobium liaoningense TaxID=43992 RepID=UPI003D9B6B6F